MGVMVIMETVDLQHPHHCFAVRSFCTSDLVNGGDESSKCVAFAKLCKPT